MTKTRGSQTRRLSAWPIYRDDINIRLRARRTMSWTRGLWVKDVPAGKYPRQWLTKSRWWNCWGSDRTSTSFGCIEKHGCFFSKAAANPRIAGSKCIVDTLRKHLGSRLSHRNKFLDDNGRILARKASIKYYFTWSRVGQRKYYIMTNSKLSRILLTTLVKASSCLFISSSTINWFWSTEYYLWATGWCSQYNGRSDHRGGCRWQWAAVD